MTKTRKIKNKRARENGEESIMALREEGFKVEKLNPYQFRINDRLDLYPTNKRFHDVIAGTRGDYWGLTIFEITRRIFR